MSAARSPVVLCCLSFFGLHVVVSENVKALDDTLLQYLSPLGWKHINLTGDYLWRSSAKIGAGKFRPLRPLSPT